MKANVTFLASVFFSVSTLAGNNFPANEIIQKNDSDSVLLTDDYYALYHTKSIDSKSNATFAKFQEYMIEEEEDVSELEDWMMNETNFGTFFTVETETEEALELEDWMTTESNFDAYAGFFVQESEEALELEDWMTVENNFFIYAEYFEVETENEIELEDWMMETENFGTFVEIEEEKEEPIKLEGWMTNPKNWK